MSDVQMPDLAGPVVLDEVAPALAPWTAVVRKGQTLRIVDLEGNQAVDFLMYALEDDSERYSAQDTIAAQGNIFLRTGSILMSLVASRPTYVKPCGSRSTTRSVSAAAALVFRTCRVETSRAHSASSHSRSVLSRFRGENSSSQPIGRWTTTGRLRRPTRSSFSARL